MKYIIDRKKVEDKVKSTLIKNIKDDVENKAELIDHINNDWYNIDAIMEEMFDAYYNNNSKYEFKYYFDYDDVLKGNLYNTWWGRQGFLLDVWNFEDLGEFEEEEEEE